MKYLGTMILTALIATLTLSAQNKDVEFGINLGANMTSILGDYPVRGRDSKTMTSFTYGMFAQFNLSETFSLVVNPAIENKGSIENDVVYYNNQGQAIRDDATIKYNYVAVPILARFTFGDDFKFYVNAGPYFAILTSAKIEYGDSVVNVNDIAIIDPWASYTNQARSFDMGLSFGAGMKFPIGDVVFLNFEIRNNLGLVNIVENGYTNGPPLPFVNGAVNNSTCFLFGFGIGI